MRRTLTNLAALGVVMARAPLARLGILRPQCTWRRVTGVGLRATGSKFALATFGLRSGFDGAAPPDAAGHLLGRLREFFRDEPCARLAVRGHAGCRVGVLGGGPDSFVFRAETTLDPARRFEPPDLCCDAFTGDELIDVVCRLSPDGRSVDVWMQFHHAAVDGAPMQEMLSRLERAWGKAEDVTYPGPAERPITARRWHRPGERPTHHALDFIDFSPLLALRQALKERHSITVGAMLTWCLARQPGFDGKRIASTVDVPATAREPRCVDFVVIRPADFEGFGAYVREFNRKLDACRSRASETRKAVRALALLPPRLALAALRENAAKRDETFGTVGLTILRDAPVFLAPYADLGFDDGFLAIGSMDLPTGDGRHVGAASAKGEAGKPDRLLHALRAAVANCRLYLSDVPV